MINYIAGNLEGTVDSQLLNLHILSSPLDLFWLRETKLSTVIKVRSKFEFVQQFNNIL